MTSSSAVNPTTLRWLLYQPHRVNFNDIWWPEWNYTLYASAVRKTALLIKTDVRKFLQVFCRMTYDRSSIVHAAELSHTSRHGRRVVPIHICGLINDVCVTTSTMGCVASQELCMAKFGEEPKKMPLTVLVYKEYWWFVVVLIFSLFFIESGYMCHAMLRLLSSQNQYGNWLCYNYRSSNGY